MTGFEPATTRPPAECATGLRYIPLFIKVPQKMKPFTVVSQNNSKLTVVQFILSIVEGLHPLNFECKNKQVIRFPNYSSILLD